MASTSLTPLSHCSLYPNFITHQKSTSTINLSKQCRSLSINANFNLFSTRRNHSCHSFSQNFIIRRFGDNGVSNLVSTTSSSSIIRAYSGRNESGGNPQQKGSGLDRPILKRWDVPWPWQTVSLSSLACGIRQMLWFMYFPLIGSSTVSMVCLLGVTGVLAPLIEETVFRGFFMTALTRWVPTPVAVVISAAVFALAHLTPGQFPQLFVLGTALGLSYSQTRNLLTPITIHAFWNPGVILLLAFLQLQGYDIKELLRAS